MCPTRAINPFNSRGFNSAWIFLALLLKNHSCCVQSSLSPLLHKVEIPTSAPITENEQATQSLIFNKYHSLSFSSQWKMRNGHLRSYYCTLCIQEPENFYFNTILLTSLTLVLTWIWFFFNQQHLDQNHCSYQQTPKSKPPWVYSAGTCSWCCKICKIWKKSAKFPLIVALGNTWRKWL